MTVEEFTHSAQSILDDTSLNDVQKNGKIIQVADLARFINAYNSSVEYNDDLSIRCTGIRGKVNIVACRKSMKGIVFYELTDILKEKVIGNEFSEIGMLDELWAVYVSELHGIDSAPLEDLLKTKKIDTFWDSIFLMDFNRSTIKKIEQKKEYE